MATNSQIEGELFHKITRDERQEECRRKWIKNRCDVDEQIINNEF